jgi:tRNA-specific 2-thiouridylase
MNNINFLNPKYENINNLKAKCKIRYRQADQNCEITKINENKYKVKFSDKQRAIASGQICAVYLENELVMSGIII